MSKKITLVLFPAIINKFSFCSEEKIVFIDSGELNKLFLQKKDIETVEQDELLNLFDIDHSEEINKIIKERTEPSLILINYPNTKNHFNSLNQKLAEEGQKIKNIILFKFNYELISSIQNEYLICPICERIFKKEEVIKENENFACLDDNNYQFPLEKINKFNEQIISHYLKNSKELIENFLQENNSSSDINQLTIGKKEEIFSGEIQKNLLSIIRNI